jgi:membrane dipeptidase|tara:strand:+ start:13543 stop:14544 length:1002 start_codon:yes stop_codon:yes gene_type:complete
MNNWGVSEQAANLHRTSLLWDMVFPIEPWCGNDYDKLARYQTAGFDLVSLCLAGDNHNIGEAVQRIASARTEVLAHPERYRLVGNTQDIRHAKSEGQLAIFFHCEGTRCFERNLEMIESFYALGVRYTLLAFNQTNSVGGGCAEKVDGGLSNFGRRLVGEMERVGMMVDLSHTGRKTTLDALEISTRPMIFSHSVVDAVHSHFRNLSDEQILACAASGGVIGMSGSNGYLGDATSQNETIFKHIDYIAELVGPEHIGLGLDLVFDNKALNDWIRTRADEWPGVDSPDWPGFSYAAPEQMPALTQLMLDHGYSEPAIKGILGENWLRVCEQVWR